MCKVSCILTAALVVEAESEQHLHLNRGRGLAARHEEHVEPIRPNGCAGDGLLSAWILKAVLGECAVHVVADGTVRSE